MKVRRRREGRDMILLGGWLFADLLLGLAMLFLTANSVGTPPPTPTPTPSPNSYATMAASAAIVAYEFGEGVGVGVGGGVPTVFAVRKSIARPSSRSAKSHPPSRIMSRPSRRRRTFIDR